MVQGIFGNRAINRQKQTAIRQSGALPYAIVDDRMAFLLVTSRRSGLWIFPKGAIEPDMTPWESAALEAYEEAGVLGDIGTQPVGRYQALAGSGGSKLIEVDLYPLLVTSQLEDWKEKGERLRHWVTLAEARRLLANGGLREIVEHFEASQLRTTYRTRALSPR